jgi:hypothetical protein
MKQTFMKVYGMRSINASQWALVVQNFGKLMDSMAAQKSIDGHPHLDTMDPEDFKILLETLNEASDDRLATSHWISKDAGVVGLITKGGAHTKLIEWKKEEESDSATEHSTPESMVPQTPPPNYFVAMSQKRKRIAASADESAAKRLDLQATPARKALPQPDADMGSGHGVVALVPPSPASPDALMSPAPVLPLRNLSIALDQARAAGDQVPLIAGMVAAPAAAAAAPANLAARAWRRVFKESLSDEEFEERIVPWLMQAYRAIKDGFSMTTEEGDQSQFHMKSFSNFIKHTKSLEYLKHYKEIFDHGGVPKITPYAWELRGTLMPILIERGVSQRFLEKGVMDDEFFQSHMVHRFMDLHQMVREQFKSIGSVTKESWTVVIASFKPEFFTGNFEHIWNYQVAGFGEHARDHFQQRAIELKQGDSAQPTDRVGHGGAGLQVAPGSPRKPDLSLDDQQPETQAAVAADAAAAATGNAAEIVQPVPGPMGVQQTVKKNVELGTMDKDRRGNKIRNLPGERERLYPNATRFLGSSFDPQKRLNKYALHHSQLDVDKRLFNTASALPRFYNAKTPGREHPLTARQMMR